MHVIPFDSHMEYECQGHPDEKKNEKGYTHNDNFLKEYLWSVIWEFGQNRILIKFCWQHAGPPS